MKKCCIVGAFGFGDLKNATGGQPVKTRELYNLLLEKYGTEKVVYVETYQWKKNPVVMLAQMVCHIPKSDVIIMLPAHNGLKVFSWLLCNLKNKNSKLFYDVIGGWLPNEVANHPEILKRIQSFNGIWVETFSMKNALNQCGLNNVSVVPNFKNLCKISPEEFILQRKTPYSLCTFSRVMKEKGITEAINAVHIINTKLGIKAFTLDIYGPIATQYEEEFSRLLEEHSDFLNYQGTVSPSNSVQTLKNYFSLLFPTYYDGEGFAGTLLDAMASGTPVIASDWKYNPEIVKERQTGILFPARDQNALVDCLYYAYQNVEKWNAMRYHCLEEAKKYQPEEVLKVIVDQIEGA